MSRTMRACGLCFVAASVLVSEVHAQNDADDWVAYGWTRLEYGTGLSIVDSWSCASVMGQASIHGVRRVQGEVRCDHSETGNDGNVVCQGNLQASTGGRAAAYIPDGCIQSGEMARLDMTACVLHGSRYIGTNCQLAGMTPCYFSPATWPYYRSIGVGSSATGVAVAEYGVTFEEVSQEDNTWSITGGGGLVVDWGRSADDFEYPFSTFATVIFDQAGQVGDVAGLVRANGYQEPRNLTYDSQAGEWAYETSIQGSGAGTVEIIQHTFTYSNERMDVDGSGRFNELDPNALASLIGSTDPNDVAKWDLDGSEDIGSNDVALMQLLVDEHFDSGLLGDFDGDGDLDCDDLDGVDSYFGYHLGETNYMVELDADFDGETTEDDRHRVYHAVLPGDVDADGDVQLDDLQALLAANGSSEGDANYNPYADIDGDGDVDLADLQALLASYGDNCN